MKYLLDTHTWIWWHTNPDKLSNTVKKIISDSEQFDELLLSAISIWELCKLVEKGKLGLSCNILDWVMEALDMFGLRLVPLTPKIAYKSTVLAKPFHEDPADQIIVATSLEENSVILTRDNRLHEYQFVQAVW